MPIKKTKRGSSKPQKKSTHKKRSKKTQPSRKRTGRRWFSWLLLGLFLVGGIGFALYCAYLDVQIRTAFEGKRWTLPARVYARPLELYSGQSVTQDAVVQELQALNYRKNSAGPGSYQTRSNSLFINTRGFTFWDGAEPERQVQLSWSDQQLTSVQTQAGDTLALLRLEPLQIATMYPPHKEDRDLIRLDDAPSMLLQTLIAVEDRDFYQHHGLKPSAIARALVINIRAGAAVQGGSTITQQLVKNFFLSNERSLQRKAVEAIMALLLELHYSKDEILEAYLNEVYLGQQGEKAIHGFALASRFYFDRSLAELDSAQLALLVGLVKGPSYYNPWKHPQRALERRNLVLQLLENQDFLSPAAAQQARLQPLQIRPRNRSPSVAYPAFLDLVKRQLQADYREADLTTEGLRIFTTMDPIVQQHAEMALNSRLQRLEQRRGLTKNSLQAAIVVTATDSGEVLALVGDRQPRYAGFNRALDARRPIGSLVKPAVYLTALQHVALYNPVTPLDDSPLQVPQKHRSQPWAPRNYDRRFHGEIPLFHGLIYSYNVATARLGILLGVEQVIETLQQQGLQQTPRAYPSLLLGALDLSLWEVTQLYQTLAAGGFQVPLRAVRDVLTADGQRLNRYPLQIKQTLDSSTVYLLNRLLQQVAARGTAKAVQIRLPQLQAAGKTGTSDELRDSWFAGFTGQHLAVVWVGRDDNQATGLSGASSALPIWLDLFTEVASRPLQLTAPKNIEQHWIDVPSGQRLLQKCDNAVLLPFIIGTAPPIESAQPVCPAE